MSIKMSMSGLNPSVYNNKKDILASRLDGANVAITKSVSQKYGNFLIS